MALPFFRNTLLGDLTYTVVFFGTYELARSFARAKKAPLVSPLAPRGASVTSSVSP